MFAAKARSLSNFDRTLGLKYLIIGKKIRLGYVCLGQSTSAYWDKAKVTFKKVLSEGPVFIKNLIFYLDCQKLFFHSDFYQISNKRFFNVMQNFN